MRILIAPDKFKDSMSSADAARAMARGAERAGRAAGALIETDICPISDGGEGFLDALAASTGAAMRSASVRGPLGEGVEAAFGVIEARGAGGAILWGAGPGSPGFVHRADSLDPAFDPGRVAVMEMSAAAGLRLVAAERRNPERTTTLGVGDLISRALDAGCGTIIIGLGGSATNDGGAGMAAALGARFFDEADRPIAFPTGGDLGRIERIDLSHLDARLGHASIIAACDVSNSLFGPRGAAHTFAAQKGATAEQVGRLDVGLRTLAERVRELCASGGMPTALSGHDFPRAAPCPPRAAGMPHHELPGAGAAGGLGFGLVAFCSARLVRGIDVVLEAVRFDERVRGAELVLTGEGRLDATSLDGKAVIGVARAARARSVATIALVGAMGEGAERAMAPLGPLARAEEIAGCGVSPEESMRRGPELLEAAAERVVREWLAAGRGAVP